MAGKNCNILLNIYFNILILFLLFSGSNGLVTLKHSLIFEQLNSRPIPVNSDAINFHRKLDLSPISDLVTSLLVSMSTFEQECNLIQQRSITLDKVKTIDANGPKYTFEIQPDKRLPHEGVTFCANKGGIIPEIRDDYSFDQVYELMTKNSLSLIPAGIRFDSDLGEYVFRSDGHAVRPLIKDLAKHSKYVHYGGAFDKNNYTSYHLLHPQNHQWHRDGSIKAVPIYKWDNYSNIAIMMGNHHDLEKSPSKTICAFPNYVEPPKIVSAYSATLCERYLPSLRNQTVITATELGALLQFQLSPSARGNSITTRTKRAAVPLIIAGALAVPLAANVISSAINGGAPLSWMGTAMAKIFGLAETSEFERPLQAILENSKHIEDLRVNIQELANITNTLVTRVNNLTYHLTQQSRAYVDYFIMEDLRSQLQTALLSIQVSGIKVISAIEDTYRGLLSPYILSQSELEQLAAKYKQQQRLTLETQRSQIKTALTRANNSLYVMITVPILDDSSYFTIYRVTPMPLFLNGSALIPEADLQYFAVNAQQSEYTVLTQDEMQQCMSRPSACQTTAVKQPIQPPDHCVIQDWLSLGPASCPLVHSNLRSPLVKQFANKTLYSVAGSIQVIINCYKHLSHLTGAQTVFLSGQGEAELPPRCTIRLNDGKTQKSPPRYEEVNLTDSKLLDILHHVKPGVSLNLSLLSPELIPLKPVSLTPWTENKAPSIIESMRSPTDHVTFVIRFLAIAGFIVAILGCCLCNSKNRLWLRSCCQLQTSDAWFSRMLSKKSRAGKRFRYWSTKHHHEAHAATRSGAHAPPTAPPAYSPIVKRSARQVDTCGRFPLPDVDNDDYVEMQPFMTIRSCPTGIRSPLTSRQLPKQPDKPQPLQVIEESLGTIHDIYSAVKVATLPTSASLRSMVQRNDVPLQTFLPRPLPQPRPQDELADVALVTRNNVVKEWTQSVDDVNKTPSFQRSNKFLSTLNIPKESNLN